jgi:hypothetical protein
VDNRKKLKITAAVVAALREAEMDNWQLQRFLRVFRQCLRNPERFFNQDILDAWKKNFERKGGKGMRG